MIRFVDLRGANTGSRFAYWDTVGDKFISRFDCYAWETFEEFRLDYLGDSTGTPGGLERFEALTPEWAKQPARYDSGTRLNEMEEKADRLVALASSFGVVVTIEQVPTQPLRMGGYESVVSVRMARTPS